MLEAGWYRTGDQGVVDARGVTGRGRLKDEINRAGFEVQPAELDMLIEQHADVAEACAFAIPDAVSGEIVGAAVCASNRARRAISTPSYVFCQ